MKARGKSWLVYYQNYRFILLKMSIMILLTTLALRLFLNHSFELHPQFHPPLVATTSEVAAEKTTELALKPVAFDDDRSSEINQFNQDDDSNTAQLNDEEPPSDSGLVLQQGSNGNNLTDNLSLEASSNETVKEDNAEGCDLFRGEWIPNPAGPAYINETCNIMDAHQNCMTNGRPDFGYLYWRWRPRDCELPLFNAKWFLKMMRSKTWGLIGDSISRNHVESLICTLSQVEKPELIYHDEEYRSKGWRFPSYNFTVYVIWSPFLVEAAIFEDFNGVSSREIELHLDRQDKKWSDVYKSLDYMIFATGKWFLKAAIYYKNNTALGCHYCPRRNLTELGFEFAYREALRTTLDFIAKSGHKGEIYFRTSTPDHFEGGSWNEGGGCYRTAPLKEGQVQVKDLHNHLRRIELDEFERVKITTSRNGLKLKMLDFMQLSLLRPDGHPGAYREYHPSPNSRVQHDCLHWCLPGPIDAWNDVIMQMVMNG